MSHKTGAGIMISVCDGWFLLHAPKVLLVLSKDELVRALKRGKAWRHQKAGRSPDVGRTSQIPWTGA